MRQRRSEVGTAISGSLLFTGVGPDKALPRHCHIEQVEADSAPLAEEPSH
jgi:hypothetical protein